MPGSYTWLVATILDSIDYRTFQSSQQGFLDSAGSVQKSQESIVPGQRVKRAGRSTACRTLRALGAVVRKVEFILWLIGAREGFKHVRDISDMFIVRNSICFVKWDCWHEEKQGDQGGAESHPGEVAMPGPVGAVGGNNV